MFHQKICKGIVHNLKKFSRRFFLGTTIVGASLPGDPTAKYFILIQKKEKCARYGKR
jgi:hypothetical protein